MSKETDPTQSSKTPFEPFLSEERLKPLNAYFTFPPEDRRAVMAALWLALRYVPTDDQYLRARSDSSRSEARIESKYGDVADVFALAIDRNYDELTNPNSKAAEYRQKFYLMIHNLTREQIDAGITKILRIESEQDTTETPTLE